MGNCWKSSSRIDVTRSSRHTSASGASKTTSAKSSSFNNPSSSSGVQSNPLSLPTPKTEIKLLSSPHLKAFSFSELRNATHNFRPDSLLGEGGFGCVYKGWVDAHSLSATRSGSGLVIAVKKLKPEGFQGHKEWVTEVNYLGQLHHPNLVTLIGYCLEAEDRLLVYEFMPKGSLENHLFRRGPQQLSWPIRLKVAIGAAKGLAFLHDAESPVIYRDFKASNILLDADFNAKLSDFGLAKAGPTGDRTHVSTQVMGTQGYAAPEYIATGRLTEKSDVYSYGVVLLELLTGRRALDRSKGVDAEHSLVDWVGPYLGDRRKLFRIMDTKMEGQYSQKAAFGVAKLAAQCTNEDARSRPRMAVVLGMLEQLWKGSRSVHCSSESRSSERRKGVVSTPPASPLGVLPPNRGGSSSPLH